MSLKVSDSDLSLPDGKDHRLHRQRPLAIASWDVGNELVSAEWDHRTFCDPYWRAYITDGPGVSLRQNGQQLGYDVDVITIIPAWSRFTFFADTRVRHAFIHSTIGDWGSPLIGRFFPVAVHVHDVHVLDRFRHLARQLLDERQSGLLLRQADGIMADCLQHIITGWPSTQQDDFWQASRHRRLDPALAYIETHLHEPIAVADIADIIGVGEARCIRLFKAAVDQTPIQYILERRVTRAVNLLAEQDLSLDTIASRCGFPNRRYLGRMFQQRMGIAPGAYRKRFIR